MNYQTELIREGRKLITRRHFFKDCGVGIGSIALASLLKGDLRAQQNPLAPKLPHFPAKAKRVIYLFQAGGPSHLDLFDYKPVMWDWFDKDLPESVRMGQRLTTMTSGQARFPIAPSMYRFEQCGRHLQFRRDERDRTGIRRLAERHPHPDHRCRFHEQHGSTAVAAGDQLYRRAVAGRCHKPHSAARSPRLSVQPRRNLANHGFLGESRLPRCHWGVRSNRGPQRQSRAEPIGAEWLRGKSDDSARRDLLAPLDRLRSVGG